MITLYQKIKTSLNLKIHQNSRVTKPHFPRISEIRIMKVINMKEDIDLFKDKKKTHQNSRVTKPHLPRIPETDPFDSGKS